MYVEHTVIYNSDALVSEPPCVTLELEINLPQLRTALKLKIQQRTNQYLIGSVGVKNVSEAMYKVYIISHKMK